jgi:hypothetical protein
MSKFAKRHYEATAEAMQWAVRSSTNKNETVGVWKAIGEMAGMFKSDNGAFDRERFLKACQPGTNVRSPLGKPAAKSIETRRGHTNV